MTRVLRLIVLVVCALSVVVARVGADELWIAPTSQQDVGGLQIASNVAWPVTPIGAVRFVFAVPNDLQAFQTAKVVLIPSPPGGPANLNVIVCAAISGGGALSNCSGPVPHPWTGVANQLVDVDISPALGPKVGAPGVNYLAVLAYTTPTTTTDHIVGMRFAYNRTPPSNVATLGANSFTGTQTAPSFVGDGSGLSNVNAGLLDGLASAAFAPALHGHDVSQVSNAATLGSNTFAGTQTATEFVGDGGRLTGVAKLTDVSTIGFATQTVSFKGVDPEPIDVGHLTINPPGKDGQHAVVKVDATVYANSNNGFPLRVFLARDDSSDQSFEQQFPINGNFGTSVSATWVFTVPSATSQTFRLWIWLSSPDNPNCIPFNSCSNYVVRSAISSVATPLP